jgi:peptide/nickel transport system substrate-binding protein
MKQRSRSIVLGLVVAAIGICGAAAQELRIGLSVAPTSIDPHFHNNGENNSFSKHVFEALTGADAQMQPIPSLAESWTQVSDSVWDFKLRKGVKFHDGTEFTADDVIFSYARVPNVPNAPSLFSSYLKEIKNIEVVDPYTLRITTKGTAPNLPINLASVYIVSRKNGGGATTQDYVTGKAMIGTGPYKFVSSRTGEMYKLARNDDYWQGKEPWETVTLRVITSAPARVAALLADDIDLIATVPANDIERLKKNKDVRIWAAPSNRTTFLALDVEHEKPIEGYATDKDKKPLDRNPMLDPRVRKALSLAINRDVLIERAVGGEGKSAGQVVPEGFFGYDPKIKPDPYDPAEAKRLLAEAGYPNGFRLVMHASGDRIPYAVEVVQAIAQMWTRVGVPTEIETMPHSVYISRADDFKYSHMLHSYGTATGEAGGTLSGIAMTRDEKAGFGTSNRGRYSNKRVDALAKEAMQTGDIEKRRALFEEAVGIVSEDRGLIPLYYQTTTWGSQADISYVPQTNQNTIAMAARPVK